VYKNKNVEEWLSVSHGLFHDLKPPDAGPEITGRGMPQPDFAALVDRETARVNEALVAMSLAKDETGVHNIFNALSRDTVIALFSRWVHYYGEWKKMINDPHPQLWVPPKDIWRAIFLAMTDDVPAASDAVQLIWGEGLKE
jgi:hypothetical protein